MDHKHETQDERLPIRQVELRRMSSELKKKAKRLRQGTAAMRKEIVRDQGAVGSYEGKPIS